MLTWVTSGSFPSLRVFMHMCYPTHVMDHYIESYTLYSSTSKTSRWYAYLSRGRYGLNSMTLITVPFLPFPSRPSVVDVLKQSIAQPFRPFTSLFDFCRCCAIEWKT